MFYTENPNATQSYRRKCIGVVIGNLTTVLLEVYNLGDRKLAFQNAGPLGCVPMSRALSSGCTKELFAMARKHNQVLCIVLQQLESKLSGFKYSILDYYSSLEDTGNNPSKYGQVKL
ncbi:GDSL esterase/lipase 1-like [Quillaja saponaria]|uniref:GDSL esterase/lipase 1-like n=1 Tax=Quillaja saponaria TaxID=32244 RepID=A0AAD7PDT9_QUISA|nr:GDSL esterase/lipase 1-like [Quillaja saponaria]